MPGLNIQNVIDGLMENIAIVDEKGVILHTNKAWSEFSRKNNGFYKKTAVGANYFSVIHKAANEGDKNAIQIETAIQDILSNKISTCEIEYPCHSDNEQRWFIANIQEIASTSKRQFIFTHKNVTNLVVRENNIAAAQRIQALGQLTGGIAHDFNNLLSIIMGNIELANLKVSKNSEIHRNLNTALVAIKRGESLIQNLLSFARNQSLKPENIDVIILLENTLSLIKPTLNRGINIILQLDEKPIMINVDTTMFTTAILNVAINAQHAMDELGEIKISASKKKLNGKYFFSSEKQVFGSFAHIEILDTGCGISKENLYKVMDPFYTTKEIGNGSGLGLSMVYGFIKQSKGHINISSQVGKGTSVSLYLPLDESNN